MVISKSDEFGFGEGHKYKNIGKEINHINLINLR
jgi:hypothetical protein